MQAAEAIRRQPLLDPDHRPEAETNLHDVIRRGLIAHDRLFLACAFYHARLRVGGGCSMCSMSSMEFDRKPHSKRRLAVESLFRQVVPSRGDASL